ncbi:lyase family protein [Rhodococcus opacus]|uniref:lyase family protein n=1 Tax=Rhodococcus opacus TaxID=37919 RepID=UPI0003024903|nr:lyase family protein [Rhodococcus opacus]AHK29119.1 Aspartate ammonia-lyase [Rhodococcus opacus PD630]UDG98929.1 aspartate ammonia-lyase [Rhodococcus opacus PD630]
MDHTQLTPTTEQPLYGEQTTLSLNNFPGPGRTLGDVPAFVRNYARVKLAAAQANHALGVLDSARRDAIVAACREIVAGNHATQFPSALLLGGGGTTTNMNVNEVIAARATRLAGVTVHPNDHVNASQSTNDSYPTAMALTVLELAESPLQALDELAAALENKGTEFDDTPHLGRTCLRDAVSLTAGQSHRAQVAAIRRTTDGLRTAVNTMRTVPLGATAVGTGIGTPAGYRELAVTELATATGRQLLPAPDLFDALAHLDPYADIAAAGARAGLTIAKVAADIRLLSSGPVGGFGDLTIPTVQAGSSIMPAKVNPAIPEYVMQLSYRIRGAAHTVEFAVSAGELELNVMEPVIVDALVTIFDDLTAAAISFARRCVTGLTWNGRRREDNLAGAFDTWVTLSATAGYEATTARYRSEPVCASSTSSTHEQRLPVGPLEHQEASN